MASDGLISSDPAKDAVDGPPEEKGETTSMDSSVKLEHGLGVFNFDLADALTPDPGTEDMFRAEDNKFAFVPGQLSKMLNPKSLNAFYAMGGLTGLEKGLRTARATGLSADEMILDGIVTFDDVATQGAVKYGAAGETLPRAKDSTQTPSSSSENTSSGFIDRKRIFRDNRLPGKKTKTLL